MTMLLGCEVERSSEPKFHPPIFSYGDQITVGETGEDAGVIIGIHEIVNGVWVRWKYSIMFENNRIIVYFEDEIRLFRRMDWHAPQIDKILLSNEPPVISGNAEIENEEAFP